MSSFVEAVRKPLLLFWGDETDATNGTNGNRRGDTIGGGTPRESPRIFTTGVGTPRENPRIITNLHEFRLIREIRVNSWTTKRKWTHLALREGRTRGRVARQRRSGILSASRGETEVVICGSGWETASPLEEAEVVLCGSGWETASPLERAEVVFLWKRLGNRFSFGKRRSSFVEAVGKPLLLFWGGRDGRDEWDERDTPKPPITQTPKRPTHQTPKRPNPKRPTPKPPNAQTSKPSTSPAPKTPIFRGFSHFFEAQVRVCLKNEFFFSRKMTSAPHLAFAIMRT